MDRRLQSQGIGLSEWAHTHCLCWISIWQKPHHKMWKLELNQFMYLLWDVAEVLKQSSHQAKRLSGFSNQGNVHLTQAATFSFPENFPFLLWLPGSSKSNKNSTSSKCTEFLLDILCITLSLTVSCFPAPSVIFTLILKNLHLSVLLLQGIQIFVGLR